MSAQLSYKDWHIPFRRDQLTLREARSALASVGAGQQDIPLMIQLVENPRFRIPGLTLFHGAVDLPQHDNIHIILGRGLLDMDEAFTIGFTMGSTCKVSSAEETLFALIAKHLYPEVYQFNDQTIAVFKDALRLGFISGCRPLDEVDFTPFLDQPLQQVRRSIGLEGDLLLAYYAIEARRYPDSAASRRLLDE